MFFSTYILERGLGKFKFHRAYVMQKKKKIGQGDDQHGTTESRIHGKERNIYMVHKGYDILKRRYRPRSKDFRHMEEYRTYIR